MQKIEPMPEVTQRCNEYRQLTPLWRCALVVLTLAAPGAVSAGPGNDNRELHTSSSPQWLNAVAKLQVPGTSYRDGLRRHHREDCSATLVVGPGQGRPDTLVTAWHCLETYRDLARPPTVTLTTRSGELLVKEVYTLADGGGMHADWAILRLFEAPGAKDVTALPIQPGHADQQRPITMAGYSRDAGLGAGGEALTFDPACRITSQQGRTTATNCTAHKGASGGAVVQLSSDGLPRLAGVISEGNGENYSTYVPIERFRRALDRHLGRSL